MISFAILLALVATAAAEGQDAGSPAAPKTSTDYGPFFCATVKAPAGNLTPKGIVVTLDAAKHAYLCYDEDLLRAAVGWTGDWLKTGNYLKEIIHPQPPEIAGTPVFATMVSPGWIKGDNYIDPRPVAAGPLPKGYAHYRGLYRDGDKVVLAYTVGTMNVIERPAYVERGGLGVFTRTFEIDKLDPGWAIVAAEGTGEPIVAGTALSAVEGNKCVAVAASGTRTRLEFTNSKLVVRLLGDAGARVVFEIAVWGGPSSSLNKFVDAHNGHAAVQPISASTKGGPARWPQPVITRGKVGASDAPYVVDTLTEPVPNPWNTKTFFSGLDFFPDGRAAICTFHGDVWIVSGIDDKLDKLTWKRFASGLFQPLGLKIVDGIIHVTCRDALMRLYDLNNDGEADFCENFNNDTIVTLNYHEFCMDLQRDSAGNFYYFKAAPWTPEVTSPHQGTCLKVSKDGSTLEVYATGFRAPNGSGMGPGDLLTVSDNEGHWMPTSKLNIVKKGGFYGMTPSAQRELVLEGGETNFFTANPSDPATRARLQIKGWDAGAQAPTNYDQPICWLPKGIDNSSGGQVWSTGGKWGPLDNHMLFMSYGRGTLFEVMSEEVDGVTQAGMVRFPFKFNTGIMRGRENPRDGQIYLCGLRGWQTDGLKDGGLYRVRYTGKPVRMPVDLHVKAIGVAITFPEPLDEAAAKDVGNYSVEQWNYIYSGNYGSPEVSPDDSKKKGHDAVEVKAATLSADKKTVLLDMPVRPVMQMKIKFSVKAADGAAIKEEIYNTVHKVPAR